MEKGINLSLTKSLSDFETMLDKAIEEASPGKLTVLYGYPDSAWKFQVGRYVQLENGDEEDAGPIFWVGYDWGKNDCGEPMLWLEFDASTCPPKHWERLQGLAGNSGKYCSEVDFEFAQVYMNAWVHFYLGENHLQRFYDENADPNAQREILSGFLREVLEMSDPDGPPLHPAGDKPAGMTKRKSSRKSLPLPALERLYVIDSAIASGKYPNTNDLVECLKRASGDCKSASISTIGRDIDFMRDRLKAPIEYDSFNKGYYYTQKTFRLPGIFTSP